MGQSLTVTVVFERAPTRAELTAFVEYCRDACRLPTHMTDFENRLDPDGHDDAAIADALLTTDRPRHRLDIGAGDIAGSLWFQPKRFDERDAPEELEGARKLPSATFSIQDVYFYPDSDEPDRAVVERTEDFVTFVERLYEGFAAYGPQPAYVYCPLPGTRELLPNPESGITVSKAAVTDGVPSTVFWLQLYPPSMVERVGRERLLSAPAWHTEQLADGAVIVVVWETPSLYTDIEHSVEAVAEHVGLE